MNFLNITASDLALMLMERVIRMEISAFRLFFVSLQADCVIWLGAIWWQAKLWKLEAHPGNFLFSRSRVFPSPEAINLEIPYPVQSLCQDGSSQLHQFCWWETACYRNFMTMVFYSCRQGDIVLPPYYQPEEDDEMPFICSLSGDNGIMGCHEIPPLKERGHECCLDKDDYYYYNSVRQEFNISGMCVNWNQYYNVCRTGNANPHKGAINFDNIGYAWIVIFQVRPS